jgi:hypothetical protein
MVDFLIFANLTLLIPHLMIKKLQEKNRSLNILSQLTLLLGPIYHILIYQMCSFLGLNRYYLNLLCLIGLLFLIMTIDKIIKSIKPLLIESLKSWVRGKRTQILGAVIIVISISLQFILFFDSRFSDLSTLSIYSKNNVDNNPSYYPTGILSFLAFFTFRIDGNNQFEKNQILLFTYIFLIYTLIFIINFLRLYYDLKKILIILVLILGVPSPLSYALIFPSSTQILLIVILFICVIFINFNLVVPNKYFIIILILMSAASISSLHIYAPVTLFLSLSMLLATKLSKNSWKLIVIFCAAPFMSVLYFFYKSSLIEILNVILPSKTSSNLIALGQELIDEFNFSLKYTFNTYLILLTLFFIIIFYYIIKIKSSNNKLNFLFLSGGFSLVSVLFGLFEVNFFRGRLFWFFQLYVSILVLEFLQSKKIIKQE